MTVRNVAIRLGIDGKAEAKRDLREIGDSGNQAFKGIGDAAEREAQRAQRAFDRAGADIEAAQARQARAAAKLSVIAPQSSIQMRIGDAVGTGYGDAAGSARASAAAFRELLAEQDRMEAKAKAIKAALDPLTAANDRYNLELAEMRALHAAGHLSADQLAQAELRLKGAFDQAAAAAARGGVSAGARAAGFRQLGQNIGDVAVQAQTGTSVLMIMSMQAGQLAQAMELIGGTGKMGAFMRFLGGPWTQVGIAAVSILALLYGKSKEAGEEADRLTAKYGMHGNAARTLRQAIEDLTNAQDRNTLSKEDAANRSVAYSAYLYKEAAATREVTKTQLELALARLSAAQAMKPMIGSEGDGSQAFGEAILGAQVDKLKAQLAENNAAIKEAQTNYRNAKADRAEFFATADVDAAARANKAYAETVKDLRKQFREGAFGRGKEAEAELRQRIGDAQRVRDAAKTAEADAAREAKKAQREALKDQREYQRSLEDLLGKYDPLADAAREYADELERIGKLQVSADKKDEYRAAAQRSYFDKRIAVDQARSDADDQKIGAILSRPGGISDQVANDNDRIADKFREDLDRWAADVEKRNRVVRASMQELRDAGEQFVDNVLNPDAWRSWGSLGKTIINEIRTELLKLALVNPIKNFLFGGGLPTLGGLFSGLGGPSTAPISGGPITYTAAGTEYFGGGWTYINENGAELVKLPRGSKVTPAGETRRLMGGSQQAETHIHVYAEGAVLAETVRGWVAEGIEVAATRGAQGGATLAQMQAVRRAQRTFR